MQSNELTSVREIAAHRANCYNLASKLATCNDECCMYHDNAFSSAPCQLKKVQRQYEHIYAPGRKSIKWQSAVNKMAINKMALPACVVMSAMSVICVSSNRI